MNTLYITSIESELWDADPIRIYKNCGPVPISKYFIAFTLDFSSAQPKIQVELHTEVHAYNEAIESA